MELLKKCVCVCGASEKVCVQAETVLLEAMNKYPSSIYVELQDSDSGFFSVAATVIVPYLNAEAMLSLGRDVIDDQYMEALVAKELGNIGVFVDIVQPPLGVAVGRWFVEIDGLIEPRPSSSSSFTMMTWWGSGVAIAIFLHVQINY